MPDSPRLSHRIKLRNHAPLATLDDVYAYLVALPPDLALQPAWRKTVAVALDARLSPDRATMAALTRQIEQALLAAGQSESSSKAR